ncbi:hypothetical protein Tco_1183787 [Tanacetum coccineum]
MPTEMELTLEQTQQGVSYEVSNIRVNSFTMKMEILLEPTSNKLMARSDPHGIDGYVTDAQDHNVKYKFKEQAQSKKSMITTTYSQEKVKTLLVLAKKKLPIGKLATCVRSIIFSCELLEPCFSFLLVTSSSVPTSFSLLLLPLELPLELIILSFVLFFQLLFIILFNALSSSSDPIASTWNMLKTLTSTQHASCLRHVSDM